MTDANSEPNYFHFEHLTRFLMQSASLEFVDARLAQNRNFYIHVVRVSESYHRVGIPAQFPIIYPNITATNKSSSLSDILEEIIPMLNGLVEGSRLLGVLVPVTVPVPEVRQLLRRRGWQNYFVVLDKENFHKIERGGFSEFEKIISTQQSLKVLNPYTSHGPVTEDMFFGREKETMYAIEKISDHCLVYIGGRRIGKTSFLLHLSIELNKRGTYNTFYINCEVFDSAQGFYHKVRDLIMDNLVTPTRIGRSMVKGEGASVGDAANDKHRELKGNAITNQEQFASFVEEVSAFLSGKQIVLLLDEVDLLVHAHPEMFKALRSLYMGGVIRCIFCGERGLDNAVHDSDHSMSNFGDVQPPFRFFLPDETSKLIVEPFEYLGIKIKSESDVIRVIKENTANRPNLVQELCRRLVDDLADRIGDEQPMGKRVITVADVARVTSAVKVERIISARAHQPYFDVYIESMWGRCNLLARAISILFEPGDQVTPKEVLQKMRKEKFRVTQKQCEDALGWLCLYNLAEDKGRQFRFVHHGFRKILELRTSAEDMLISLREEIEEKVSHGTV
ncbi:MAG: AAA family ATPase [Nitrospirae bacterium]|nr:AAA family ATPase [Nitrospirota bacterium]